jgi:hypothetical protein
MDLSALSFILMIVIEGCAGPLPSGQGCTSQNFSVRVPYDKIDQCEEARKRLVAPAGVQKYIRTFCMAVPKSPLEREPVS